MYIPKEWIQNEKNEEMVYKIINRETDVIFKRESIVDELLQIGERLLAEKVKNGEIIHNV